MMAARSKGASSARTRRTACWDSVTTIICSGLGPLSGGLTFLAAAIAFIAVKSPVALLVDFISGFLNLSTTISLVQSTLQRWLQISPLPLTIALSLVVISWISLISTAWVFTMWKINQQGVQS